MAQQRWGNGQSGGIMLQGGNILQGGRGWGGTMPVRGGYVWQGGSGRGRGGNMTK